LDGFTVGPCEENRHQKPKQQKNRGKKLRQFPNRRKNRRRAHHPAAVPLHKPVRGEKLLTTYQNRVIGNPAHEVVPPVHATGDPPAEPASGTGGSR
jgi:hypothetical protein